MFYPVIIEQGRIMKSLLGMGNGKFLAIIITMLVLYVTWYTQSSTLALTKKIDNLERDMQLSDVALRKDIGYLKEGQKETQLSTSEVRKDFDSMVMLQRVNSAWESESINTKEILKEVLNEYKIEEKPDGP